MEKLLEGLPMYMMIGIILVIGVSQFNRMIGGMLGVVFWIAVGFVGGMAYDQGHSIGFPGFKEGFSRGAFYTLCGLFGAFSAFSAYTGYLKRTRFRPPPRDDSEV